MALLPEKLRILTFPQRISGDQLELNVLLLPTQGLLNIQQSFGNVDLPKFIGANLQLEVTTLRGLSSYPFSNPDFLGEEVTADTHPTTLAFPANLPLIYKGLAAQFKLTSTNGTTDIGAGDPWADGEGIRKYLPGSYRSAFNFTTPRTEYAKTDDSYHCAFKNTTRKLNFQQSGDEISWGRVIAFCLRQPLLAKSIGLLHQWKLTLPDADYFADGGWVYFHLTSPPDQFGINDPATELREYAARIPDIKKPRQLFAALLFPVVPGPAPPTGEFDLLKIEAADYDDGFAKIVHAFQPVSANILSEEPDGIHVQKDVGIRLGWDDEQLLIWQNRQVLADPTASGAPARIDAPLGVFSYRVDVREKAEPENPWASLVRIQNMGHLALAGKLIAQAFTPMESGVQVYPSKINADSAFWLPSYFTQWYGPSLVLPDERAAQLDASGALADPGNYDDSNIDKKPDQKGGLYKPLLPSNPELKYGKQYEFRVRLADMTGGGPLEADDELNDAPAKSASIVFKRYVAPKQLKVVPQKEQLNSKSATNVFYEGNTFEISRPRLGYPALLFTEMDTVIALQKLLDDKTFLHNGKVDTETFTEKIKDQREVSDFDPDVDRFMVIVEVKSLLLDNLASLNQREAFIPLYKTMRTFFGEAFTLELEYREADVINFENKDTFGDLKISQKDIDAAKEIVLPTSRDIRITLLPVCSEKQKKPEYFGFAETLIAGEFVRAGEPIQFFVREDATAETGFFKIGPESRQVQCIYLQPDPPKVNNVQTFVPELVAGKELEQSTLMQRLASQLKVDFKGLTLIGKPGERIQFGCSNRIRHTLAPDNSSLTFSTKADLFNHWLCVLSFEINRDWTWRGLSDTGIEVGRKKEFTGELQTPTEIVGYVQLKDTASRVATTNPNRSYTRVLFIDAVEPKKDATLTNPFPNTIELAYRLTPQFISSVTPASAEQQIISRELRLPVTTIPSQVPKVVAAGYALSPYRRDEDYSETAVRKRYVWLEFEHPIEDPNDTYFARILTYAPDPLLSLPNLDQVMVQEEPPLGISPELIRVITHDQSDDNAGIDAMQMMLAEISEPAALVKVSPVHYLLPLPPGSHDESNELFGFFTYEIRVGHRVGHKNQIWSTAQGRFGHPIRVNGVQHPAPPLKLLVDRSPKGIIATAQYAMAVFNGRNVTSKPPKTEIWCMLYAQTRQADAKDNRNILLSEKKLAAEPNKFNIDAVNLDAPATGVQGWTELEVKELLERFNLHKNTQLSVLAVEMMPRYDLYFINGPPPDTSILPLSRELGQYRILRTSRLVAAPEIC